MPPCFHATGHWQLSIEVSVGEGFYPARPITDEFPFSLRRGRCLHRPATKTYLLSVGATLAVARGRGRAPPLRTINNASVGADASVRPPGLHRISYNVSLRSQCAHWLWQSVSPVPKTTAHFIFPYSLKSPSLPHSSHFFHIFPVAKYCPTPYNKLCNRFVTFPHKKPVFLIERNL